MSINPFKLALAYFYDKETRTKPARWTNTFINCLFVSFMWLLIVLSNYPSWLPKLNLPPNYNWADRSSAPSFLFCQLPLSFIKGRAFCTSTEISFGFPLGFGGSFFVDKAWLSTAASPSKLIFGFFCYWERGLIALN